MRFYKSTLYPIPYVIYMLQKQQSWKTVCLCLSACIYSKTTWKENQRKFKKWFFIG